MFQAGSIWKLLFGNGIWKLARFAKCTFTKNMTVQHASLQIRFVSVANVSVVFSHIFSPVHAVPSK